MPRARGESATSPRRVSTAIRRGKALQMRLDGARYQEIADTLGYSSKSSAIVDVQRALVATTREPADEVRALELQRLDMMWQAVLEVLRQSHVVVNNGRVIYLGDEPLTDYGPVLAAIDRLLKIQERRAKYLGLDAAKQFEVVTVDAIDSQIRALTAELERAAEAAGEDEDAGEFDGVEAAEAGAAAGAEG